MTRRSGTGGLRVDLRTCHDVLSAVGVDGFAAPEKAIVDERPRPFGPPLAWDA
jgi:hypothetical protein